MEEEQLKAALTSFTAHLLCEDGRLLSV